MSKQYLEKQVPRETSTMKDFNHNVFRAKLMQLVAMLKQSALSTFDYWLTLSDPVP